MVAERAGQDELVAAPDASGRRPADRVTDAGRVDVDLVALALRHDLGVACHDRYARQAGRPHDGPQDLVQRRLLQPLLQDEAEREEARGGAGDDEVVDRAVDGQPADVAAGEEERVDDVAVGGEGQAAGEEGRVAELPEDGVPERLQDAAGDELAHEPPAAAELEADPLRVHARPRAPGPRPYL